MRIYHVCKQAFYVVAFFVGIFDYANIFCKKTILFDLGGVLLNPTNKLSMAFQLGIFNMFGYMIFDRKSPDALKFCLFDALGHLGKQEGYQTEKVRAQDGTELPDIMCKWLAGIISGPEIIKLVSLLIEQLDNQKYFSSAREKDIIKNAVQAMFDPFIFAQHTQPIQEAVELVARLAETGQYRLMILSNWDPISFSLLMQKPGLQRLWSCFDPRDIIISGHIGMTKPHKNCFEYALKTYKINPRECIYIDDQEENIHAAVLVGMNTIWFNNENYKALGQSLAKFGIHA